MFFKIGALKNLAIFRIKKGLQHTCFPVRNSHVMLTYRQISFSKCWDRDFIPLYLQHLFLKKWSITQYISLCSVKIKFPNCKQTKLGQFSRLHFFTRDVDQYKNTSLSQLYKPPRPRFPQKTYHQLLPSCEYCKVFKKSFLQNTSRSSRLQMFFEKGVLKSFPNFTGKHLCWSLFSKNLQAEGLQLY